MIAYIGVLHFYKCSNLGSRSDTRIATDIGIGSDDRSFSAVDVALDIGSRLQDNSFLEIDISFYGHIWFDNCSFIYCFIVSSDDRIVGPQEIPWVADRDPPASSLDHAIESFLDIDVDKIRDLELSSW